MKLDDAHIRPGLFENVYGLERSTTLYREVLDLLAPDVDAPHIERLCSLMERTVAQTRFVLEHEERARGTSLKLQHPRPLERSLRFKLQAAREERAAAVRPRRPSL